ncbi:MAG: DUF2723 domain-containing protein [Chloroflexi bacterium]|nr:DUF2723 domain-containing protein [Chloroflexota bacterium]
MVRKRLGTVDVWLIGLGALLLYGATAAPGIAELFDDSLEFQLVAPTFAIAHPTGYPLYTLLGGLCSRLLFPIGNWAWRMNIFSALAGAGTIALLYLLTKRLNGGDGWSGLAGAITFALGPVWWAQATVAEVYALHNLFVVALLYAAVSLGNRPTNRQITVLCILAGLSLTHHRTAILLLPGLALYLLWTQPDLRRPQPAWLLWLGAFLLPLLLYLYIPLRSLLGAADLEGDYSNTWAGFWRHVLASGYTGFFADNSLAVSRTAGEWLALVVAQFGWPPLALGVGGLAMGLIHQKQRAAWGLVWLTLAANLLFALNYRVADVEVFWLPVFLCLALGVGNSAHWLCWLAARLGFGKRKDGSWLEAAFLLALLALVVSGWGGRGATVNRSDDWAAHTYALALAGIDFPPNSQVVGLRGQMTALQFMQASAGMAAHAQAVALDDPDERRAFVVESVAAGLPVYLTQEVAGIEDAYSFSGEGVLVRVWPRGEAQAGAPTHPLTLPLLDGHLQLTGYDIELLSQPGEPALRVAFYWRPTAQLSQRLKLSLRLLDGAGEVIWAEDRYPLRQVASTSAWLPGEIVRDVYDLSLPSAPVELLVIVYDEATVAEAGRVTVPLP